MVGISIRIATVKRRNSLLLQRADGSTAAACNFWNSHLCHVRWCRTIIGVLRIDSDRVCS